MRSFVLLTVAFFWTTAQSQEQEVPDTVLGKSETLEEILEEITQDATDSQLADILAQLEERPLDLNMSTESELQQIPGITPMLALRIVLFRERKWFTSVNELIGVEGMTNDLFARIRKYLTVVRLTEEGAPAVFGLRDLQ
ncbi:MAG: helix-hairpin-helix domain-containing protein [Ignavibacteriales bacterium]|nr:helix-hairpin-helix domain-containing protein [Ignavibacteriales bacterium]